VQWPPPPPSARTTSTVINTVILTVVVVVDEIASFDAEQAFNLPAQSDTPFRFNPSERTVNDALRARSIGLGAAR
jgi:hypothetical protein